MKMKKIKERIRRAYPIKDVIARNVDLTESDEFFTGCCPFHKEKTPSLLVIPKNSSFHCFTCGLGGDVLTYLMLYKGVGVKEVISLLGQKVLIKPPADDNFYTIENRKIGAELLLRKVLTIYHRNLPDVVKGYLLDIGYSDKEIDRNLMGYCNGGEEYGIDVRYIKALGLVNDDGEEYFKNYITYPLLSGWGQVKGADGIFFPVEEGLNGER